MVKYNKEPIPDKKIRQNIELPANNPEFKYFKECVNGECEKAITDLYGKFSPLSSPISTQTLPSSFDERFKVTLPPIIRLSFVFWVKESHSIMKG